MAEMASSKLQTPNGKPDDTAQNHNLLLKPAERLKWERILSFIPAELRKISVWTDITTDLGRHGKS